MTRSYNARRGSRRGHIRDEYLIKGKLHKHLRALPAPDTEPPYHYVGTRDHRNIEEMRRKMQSVAAMYKVFVAWFEAALITTFPAAMLKKGNAEAVYWSKVMVDWYKAAEKMEAKATEEKDYLNWLEGVTEIPAEMKEQIKQVIRSHTRLAWEYRTEQKRAQRRLKEAME